MLITLSPAKALDMETPRQVETSAPRMQAQADMLAAIGRDLSVADLRDLMKLSENLGQLTWDRFAGFTNAPLPDETRPAIYAFAGDTYRGFEAATLGDDAIRWAQRHVRILSGLYGVLRPLDAIQPYRLEMGTRLATDRGKTLYDFWGDQIARALLQDARDIGSDVVINCASVEYFRAADRPALGLRVITPVFMENKAGVPRIVSFYAKQARGAMARFAAETGAQDPESLKDFNAGGYAFRADMSEPDRWVFLREVPEG